MEDMQEPLERHCLQERSQDKFDFFFDFADMSISPKC